MPDTNTYFFSPHESFYAPHDHPFSKHAVVDCAVAPQHCVLVGAFTCLLWRCVGSPVGQFHMLHIVRGHGVAVCGVVGAIERQMAVRVCVTAL